MNVLKALRKVIVENVPVEDVIGQKCYSGIAPQKAQVPFVVLSIVNVDPTDTKSGVSTTDVFRIQVDSYAATYDACQDLDKKVRTAIDKYMDNVSFGDERIYIDGVRYLTSQDTYEEEPNEFRRISDYIVRIKES
jgi:hypothetical protein